MNLPFSITRRIGGLLLIPVAGAMLAVAGFYWFLTETDASSASINVAGRQRLLSQQLAATAHQVAEMGRADKAAELRTLVDAFDRALTALEHGGEVISRRLPPAPPEVRPHIDATQALWAEQKAGLLALAETPRDGPQTARRYTTVAANVPALREASDGIVSAFEARDRRLRQQVFYLLVAIAGLNLVLLPAGIWVTHSYVRERRQSEHALQASEQRYRRLVDTIPYGIQENDLTGTITFSNPAHGRILGYQAGELIGGKIWDFAPDDDERERIRNYLPYLVAERPTPTPFLARSRTADGRLIDVQVDWDYRWDDSGRLTGFISVISDITERQRATEALRESEARFRSVTQSANDAIISADSDGHILSWNQGASVIFGYREKEVLGMPLTLLMPERLRDAHQRGLARANATNTIQSAGRTTELAGLRKDGSEFPLELSLSQWKSGSTTFFSGIIRDITERKRTEQVLRKLAEGVSSVTGEAFFRSLALYAAESLGVEYALVAETIKGEARVRTVAVCARGQIVDNFEYTLAGTPCEKVTEGTLCCYPQGVQKLFPEDRLLVDMGVESYMGVPLLDSAGQVMGLVAILNDRPLDNTSFAESVFRLFAVRAAAELERKHAEDALRRETASKHLLQTIAIAANEATTVEAALQTAIDQICAYTECPVGHAYLLAADDSGELTPTAIWCHGMPESFTAFREATEAQPFTRGVGLPGRVLASGKPAWIADVATDPNFPRAPAAQAAGIKAGFALPVLVGDEVVAVLEFFTDQAPAIEPTIVDIMAHVGAQLGRAVERKRAQEHLRHLAHYDTLTALPNRTLFTDRLEQALPRARWHNRLVGVLLLDLDRFKRINDTLGHDIGDRLLRDVAGRLTDCIREGDTVARLGGDEFAILLADVAKQEDVPKIAAKILAALARPFVHHERELFITASIGISLHPTDGDDALTLLKNADIAMYRAKGQGKNNYQLYLPTMNAAASEYLAMETALRYALERKEFVLHFQPKIDLATDAIAGAEALVRWQRSGSTMVPPIQFIPLLEDTGLIVPVGEWVLRTACAQAKAWEDAGLPPQRMAVNLSARQFQQPDLAEMVTRVLEETGLAPERLELELTETILMENSGDTLATLDKLDKLGVQIAIDDFGTGYSSLSYLKRFPIDTLKIDRSFVRDITTDPNDAAISTAVIAMAHSLEIKVVAEGVETPTQLAFLRERRCDYVQGYLFSPPVPPDAATALLTDRVWHHEA